jgi:hypothetical protein
MWNMAKMHRRRLSLQGLSRHNRCAFIPRSLAGQRSFPVRGMAMSNTNNTMATEKAYIGNGRQKQGSEYITLNIDVDELLAALHNRTSEAPNGKFYLKAIVAKRRTTDMYGRTHTLYLPATEDRGEQEANRLIDEQEIVYHQE